MGGSASPLAGRPGPLLAPAHRGGLSKGPRGTEAVLLQRLPASRLGPRFVFQALVDPEVSRMPRGLRSEPQRGWWLALPYRPRLPNVVCERECPRVLADVQTGWPGPVSLEALSQGLPPRATTALRNPQ